MPAETLKCPMCGASASTDSTKCSHCGSRLATVACPSCFGMMFLGAKFCSRCGAAARRLELDTEEPRPCPRCAIETEAVKIGTTCLHECPKCEGLWADAESVERIYKDREQQAAVLGTAIDLPAFSNNYLEPVRYLHCPVCRALMHRVNFAKCSHVIVDVCKPHGTWFDKDELRRIVEFIRAGGMDEARAREIRELDRKRRELNSARTASLSAGFGNDYDSGWGSSKVDLWDIAASIAYEIFNHW